MQRLLHLSGNGSQTRVATFRCSSVSISNRGDLNRNLCMIRHDRSASKFVLELQQRVCRLDHACSLHCAAQLPYLLLYLTTHVRTTQKILVLIQERCCVVAATCLCAALFERVGGCEPFKRATVRHVPLDARVLLARRARRQRVDAQLEESATEL